MAHVFTTAGPHTITFTAGVFETGYVFDVTGLELVEMRIAEQPTQLTYEVGSEFNPSGMRVVGTYNTGLVDEVTDYEITGFDSSKESDCCTVQICCGKCSCNIDVVIIPTLYLYGEKADGTMELIRYFGYDSNIIVPANVNGKPVTSIAPTCFTNSGVMNVSIPEGITYIG